MSEVQNGIIAVLFVGWYLANYLSSSNSKEFLDRISSPIILTFAQMLIGSIGCVIVLLLRKNMEKQLHNKNLFENVSVNGLKQLLPMGIVHVVGNLCTNYGFLFGTIAFVHIIKVWKLLTTFL